MQEQFHIALHKQNKNGIEHTEIVISSKDVLDLIRQVRYANLAATGDTSKYIIMKPMVWLQLKFQLSQGPSYGMNQHIAGTAADIYGLEPVICSAITSDIVLGDIPEKAGDILSREFFQKQKEANAQQTKTT